MKKNLHLLVCIVLLLNAQQSQAQILQWVDTIQHKLSYTHIENQGLIVNTDKESNIYTINISGTNESHPALYKYASDGKRLWKLNIDMSEGSVYNLVPDNSGNLFLTLKFKGEVSTPEAGVLAKSSGGTDMMILKITADLGLIHSYIWMGNSGDDAAYDLVTDKFGNVYITGHFQNEVNFDPFNGPDARRIQAKGHSDVFVAKYDNDLRLQWIQTAGDPFDVSYGSFIKINDDGLLYVGGGFYDELRIGEIDLVSVGNWDVFIGQYNAANGQFIGAARLGGSGDDELREMSTDRDGNLYVSGNYQGNAINMDMHGGQHFLQNLGKKDAFWAKYNKATLLEWAFAASGTENESCEDVVVNDRGEIIVAIDFNSDNLAESAFNFSFKNANSPFADAVLAKYTPSGNLMWAYRLFGRGNELIQDVCLDRENNIHVIGCYAYYVDFDFSQNVQQKSTLAKFNYFLAKYEDKPIVEESMNRQVFDDAALSIQSTLNKSLQPELSQNYPNPVRTSSVIRYYLPKTTKVTIQLLDQSGKQSTVLVDEIKNSGEHTFLFERKNLPPGIYYYQMTADGKKMTRSMLLL